MAEFTMLGAYDDVTEPLFTEPLTAAEVLEHMRAAVEAYGAEYRDPAGAGRLPYKEECQYIYDDGKRCIVGEVVWRARGVQVPANAGSADGLIKDGVLPVADDDARRLIALAQGQQDDGHPWGGVLELVIEAGDCDG